MIRILKAINEEHKRLNKMLDDVQASKENRGELFNKFKLNLNKHYAIEEKGILDSFAMMQGKEASNTFDIIQDHNELRALVNEIELKLKTNEAKDKLDELKVVLNEHEKFEEEEFYPMLGETLSPTQIEDIVKKCKEIL